MVKKSAKKIIRASRKSIFIIIALSVVLAIFLSVYKSYFTPVAVSIMAIDPVTDGQTTLEGVIQSNMSPNEKGSFILLLRDTRIVKLDIKGIRHLVGLPVTVSGIVSHENSDIMPINMKVESITVYQE